MANRDTIGFGGELHHLTGHLLAVSEELRDPKFISYYFDEELEKYVFNDGDDTYCGPTQSFINAYLFNRGYTKDEVDSKISASGTFDDTQYYKKSEINKMGYVTTSDIVNMSYATKEYVTNEISNIEYELPIASESTLGGVKVGSGLSIDSATGVLSATGGGTADAVAWANITSKPTTISGFNITDAYIDNGLVYLGGQSIEPVTIDDLSDYITSDELDTTLSEKIIVDANLDSSSTNPVQNKAIYAYLGNYFTKEEVTYRISASGTFVSYDYYNKYNVDALLNSYVSKSDLNTLAYVSKSDLNTLGYATISDVVKMGYLTSSDVVKMGYVTTSDIVKMGYLTSSDLSNYATKSDLENVNIDVDTELKSDSTNPVQNKAIYSYLSNYYTKSEVDKKINDSGTFDASQYYTKEDFNKIGYVKASDIVNMGYVTSSKLDDTLSSYVKSSDLSNNYYTKSEISKLGYVTSTKLSETLSSYVKSSDLSDNYYTKEDFNTIGYIKASDLSNAFKQVSYASSVKLTTTGTGNAVSEISLKYDNDDTGTTYTFSVTKTNIEASSGTGDVADITVTSDGTTGDYIKSITPDGHTLTVSYGSVSTHSAVTISGSKSSNNVVSDIVLDAATQKLTVTYSTISATTLGAITKHQTIYSLSAQQDGTTFDTFSPASSNDTLNFVSGYNMTLTGSNGVLTIASYATYDTAIPDTDIEKICSDVLGI